MRTLSVLTISALALSMGVAGWAIHEQRQKNKLERDKLKAYQEAREAGKASTKETSPAQ